MGNRPHITPEQVAALPPARPDVTFTADAAALARTLAAMRPVGEVEPAPPGPLVGLLDAAVPLWIARLSEMDAPTFWATFRQWTEGAEAAGVFDEAVLFDTRRPGASAQAFNGLAKAIAALAFVPEGIRIFGRQWVATPPTSKGGGDDEPA